MQDQVPRDKKVTLAILDCLVNLADLAWMAGLELRGTKDCQAWMGEME